MASGRHSQQISNKFSTTNHTSVASLPQCRMSTLLQRLATLFQHPQHIARVWTLSTRATWCDNKLLRVDLRAPVASTHNSCECDSQQLWVCCGRPASWHEAVVAGAPQHIAYVCCETASYNTLWVMNYCSVWILVKSRQMDRNWCIRTHHAICTGGLKKDWMSTFFLAGNNYGLLSTA